LSQAQAGIRRLITEKPRVERIGSTEEHTDRVHAIMSSPKREGSENANSSSNNGNLDEKPRLSEHEKKANHIASGMHIPFYHLIILPTIIACESRLMDSLNCRAET
jgi:hypothetical protein